MSTELECLEVAQTETGTITSFTITASEGSTIERKCGSVRSQIRNIATRFGAKPNAKVRQIAELATSLLQFAQLFWNKTKALAETAQKDDASGSGSAGHANTSKENAAPIDDGVASDGTAKQVPAHAAAAASEPSPAQMAAAQAAAAASALGSSSTSSRSPVPPQGSASPALAGAYMGLAFGQEPEGQDKVGQEQRMAVQASAMTFPEHRVGMRGGAAAFAEHAQKAERHLRQKRLEVGAWPVQEVIDPIAVASLHRAINASRAAKGSDWLLFVADRPVVEDSRARAVVDMVMAVPKEAEEPAQGTNDRPGVGTERGSRSQSPTASASAAQSGNKGKHGSNTDASSSSSSSSSSLLSWNGSNGSLGRGEAQAGSSGETHGTGSGDLAPLYGRVLGGASAPTVRALSGELNASGTSTGTSRVTSRTTITRVLGPLASLATAVVARGEMCGQIRAKHERGIQIEHTLQLADEALHRLRFAGMAATGAAGAAAGAGSTMSTLHRAGLGDTSGAVDAGGGDAIGSSGEEFPGVASVGVVSSGEELAASSIARAGLRGDAVCQAVIFRAAEDGDARSLALVLHALRRGMDQAILGSQAASDSWDDPLEDATGHDKQQGAPTVALLSLPFPSPTLGLAHPIHVACSGWHYECVKLLCDYRGVFQWPLLSRTLGYEVTPQSPPSMTKEHLNASNGSAGKGDAGASHAGASGGGDGAGMNAKSRARPSSSPLLSVERERDQDGGVLAARTMYGGPVGATCLHCCVSHALPASDVSGLVATLGALLGMQEATERIGELLLACDVAGVSAVTKAACRWDGAAIQVLGAWISQLATSALNSTIGGDSHGSDARAPDQQEPVAVARRSLSSSSIPLGSSGNDAGHSAAKDGAEPQLSASEVHRIVAAFSWLVVGSRSHPGTGRQTVSHMAGRSGSLTVWSAVLDHFQSAVTTCSLANGTLGADGKNIDEAQPSMDSDEEEIDDATSGTSNASASTAPETLETQGGGEHQCRQSLRDSLVYAKDSRGQRPSTLAAQGAWRHLCSLDRVLSAAGLEGSVGPGSSAAGALRGEAGVRDGASMAAAAAAAATAASVTTAGAVPVGRLFDAVLECCVQGSSTASVVEHGLMRARECSLLCMHMLCGLGMSDLGIALQCNASAVPSLGAVALAGKMSEAGSGFAQADEAAGDLLVLAQQILRKSSGLRHPAVQRLAAGTASEFSALALHVRRAAQAGKRPTQPSGIGEGAGAVSRIISATASPVLGRKRGRLAAGGLGGDSRTAASDRLEHDEGQEDEEDEAKEANEAKRGRVALAKTSLSRSDSGLPPLPSGFDPVGEDSD